jgi:mannose-P-dolichol utilization defect protein 1
VTTFAIVYLSVVTNFLPKHWHYLLMASVWPILLYARGSQIVETYQLKHTGAQSIVSTSMNLLGSSIRILTTLQEVGMDVAVLSGYVLGIVTSGIMVIQYFLYRSNTEKVLSDMKKKD